MIGVELRLPLVIRRAKRAAITAAIGNLIELGATAHRFAAQIIGQGGQRPLCIHPHLIPLAQIDQPTRLPIGKRGEVEGDGHGQNYPTK